MGDKNFLFFLKPQDDFGKKIINDHVFEYDEELQTIASVFDDLSRVFYENGLHFILQVNGTIYPTWDYELSIFLESLMKVVAFANRKDVNECEVEFYEQGINYLFDFEKVNDKSYRLDFIDKRGTSKTFHSESFLLELNLDLFTFCSQVIFLTDKVCPSISNSDMFGEWKTAISKEFGLNR